MNRVLILVIFGSMLLVMSAFGFLLSPNDVKAQLSLPEGVTCEVPPPDCAFVFSLCDKRIYYPEMQTSKVVCDDPGPQIPGTSPACRAAHIVSDICEFKRTRSIICPGTDPTHPSCPGGRVPTPIPTATPAPTPTSTPTPTATPTATPTPPVNAAPTIISTNIIEPNYCTSGPAATITWQYFDANGDAQSAYQIQIDNQSSFASPEVDTGKVLSNSSSYFTSQGRLQYNTTYNARVRVWDSKDAVSNWSN